VVVAAIVTAMAVATTATGQHDRNAMKTVMDGDERCNDNAAAM
jgi:hypothetical protein